ncbi:hypothetical protein DRO91_06055, partial [Candidatus Heimdallarchaeota archaeon]
MANLVPTVIESKETAMAEFDADASMFFNPAKFEHAQRLAKMLCRSTLVPVHFQGEQNLGNVMIALNLADRVGQDPFMVMQKVYVIHGKPGIEAQLAVALINTHGSYDPLDYEMSGEGKTRGCQAFAVHRATEKVKHGTKVTIKMAEAEGWMSKKGSKWQTMPDLMLRYRAAMFFARQHCPEALMGMQLKDELTDIQANKQMPATRIEQKMKNLLPLAGRKQTPGFSPPGEATREPPAEQKVTQKPKKSAKKPKKEQ